MKTNGEFVYDEEMIKYLGLPIDQFIQQHGKTSKAMTAAVVAYLQALYPERAEEYKLIYRKAEKFISK